MPSHVPSVPSASSGDSPACSHSSSGIVKAPDRAPPSLIILRGTKDLKYAEHARQALPPYHSAKVSKLPPGLYDLPVTHAIDRELRQLDRGRFEADAQEFDAADADLAFARHLAAVVRQVLAGVPSEDRVVKQAQIVNELLASLDTVERDDHLALPPRRLASIHRIDALRGVTRPDDPLIPLAQSDLLVNGRGEPAVGSAIQREIASADRVDLLCAFIKWHGLRLLEEPLAAYLRSGRKLRVITTTYIGATERKAIDRLVELGADVKVSYQTDHTRLHAKAWLFHRESGFSTAFVGSSNLSKSALLDGVEWNVRLSQIDAPTILTKFAATFDSYWADPDFETYRPGDADRFDRAIGQARGTSEGTVLVPFAIEPWPHQREILDKLTVERYRHNRWRNLVVAATGTGKTVVAALDYKRLCEEIGDGRPLKLLFVAHRREILGQSLVTFRHVMRDGAFGEPFVDGDRPDHWQHVFASVQSLQNIRLEGVYIRDDARIAQILTELRRKVADVRTMRALGFCVGVEHARYMARRFNEAGIASLAVSSRNTSDERDEALRKLKAREVNCVFAVDLFNEGVDVPEIDTVLFLRPTESATVFLQQLGRGLRRTSDKDCLTVLDFIGNANRNFRFDLRYRALTGATRAEVVAQVENGFPLLPAGCAIQLDRVARNIVVDNLKQAIASRFTTLVRELQSIGRPVTLLEFITEAAIDDVEDVYRWRGRTWTHLQRAAGLLGSQTVTTQIADATAGRNRLAPPRRRTAPHPPRRFGAPWYSSGSSRHARPVELQPPHLKLRRRILEVETRAGILLPAQKAHRLRPRDEATTTARIHRLRA